MFDDALDFPCVLMKLFEFSISEISNWGGGGRGGIWGAGGDWEKRLNYSFWI